MKADPTEHHRWLNRFLGEWEFDSECGPPGGETFRMAGRETFRSVGDLSRRRGHPDAGVDLVRFVADTAVAWAENRPGVDLANHLPSRKTDSAHPLWTAECSLTPGRGRLR